MMSKLSYGVEITARALRAIILMRFEQFFYLFLLQILHCVHKNEELEKEDGYLETAISPGTDKYDQNPSSNQF